MAVSAIITAGGRGTRFGSGTPKQFIPVAGRPLLAHTIGVFNSAGMIDEIVITVPREFIGHTRDLCVNNEFSKVTAVVAGGKERMQSVAAGLEAVSQWSTVIMIHDGVRPLVTGGDISALLSAVHQHGSAILALPVTDTLKRVTRNMAAETVDRSVLWRAQTPQAFRADIIRSAYALGIKKGIQATDDSQLVESAGYSVAVVKSSTPNIKVTTKQDAALVSAFMAQEEQ